MAGFYLATGPSCAPDLIWRTLGNIGEPPEQQGLCSYWAHLWANSAFWSRVVKCRLPPKRQGLCSHRAFLWAISNFVPCLEVLGTPRADHDI